MGFEDSRKESHPYSTSLIVALEVRLHTVVLQCLATMLFQDCPTYGSFFPAHLLEAPAMAVVFAPLAVTLIAAVTATRRRVSFSVPVFRRDCYHPVRSQDCRACIEDTV